MAADPRTAFLSPVILVIGLLLSSPLAHATDAPALLDTDALATDAAPDTSQVLVALDNPSTPVTIQLASFRPDVTAEAPDPALAGEGEVLQTGTASWYGRAWSGRRTASGTRFNPEAMTAASHTLPLGTRVLVTLEGTARSVLVTITDHQGCASRVIDLSAGAARKIGMMGMGVARVVLRRG